MTIDVHEITELAAYRLVGADHFRLPAPDEAPEVHALVRTRIGVLRERADPPAIALRVLTDRLALAYVLEDDFPGSGIYRVTVTP